MARFPEFLIVGAQKSGTTSLWQWLHDHPECYLPEIKEPHYFARFKPWDTLLRTGWFVRDPDAYINLFSAAQPSQVCGESSPSYLYEDGVAQRIKEIIPSCLIIISLRDPVHRAYSEYLMNVISGFETRSFSDAILDAAYGRERNSWDDFPLYIELSKYGSQIARYYDVFPREQILITTTAQISQYPLATMEKISAFLGISTDFWSSYSFPRKNPGSEPRNALTKKLLNSSIARRVGRVLVNEKFRPLVAQNILGRPSSSKKDITTKDREIIWSICESEIRLVESIIGRHLPELWETYPEKTNG